MLHLNEFFRKNKIFRFFALLFIDFTLLDISSKSADYQLNVLTTLFLSLLFISLSLYIIFLGYEILYEMTSIGVYQIDLPFPKFLKLTLFSTLFTALFLFLINQFITESLPYLSNFYLIFFSSLMRIFFYLVLITIIGSRSLNKIFKKVSLFLNHPKLIIYSTIIFVLILFSEFTNHSKTDLGNYTFLLIYMQVIAGILIFSLCLVVIKKWQVAFFAKKLEN
ncbi:hypothetical protein AB3N60_03470 [Leptospira sp. WS39.C2]